MSAPDSAALLNEKLDVLIRIQAALAIKDLPTQRDKIVFLYGAGLGPNYISSLLGVKPSTVSGTMAKHKKMTGPKGDSADE